MTWIYVVVGVWMVVVATLLLAIGRSISDCLGALNDIRNRLTNR